MPDVRHCVAVALVATAFAVGAPARPLQSHGSFQAQSAPFPDEQRFFAETRENLARATRVQFRYAYRERRTELHMNPFGRVGTGGMVLYQVTPAEDGSATIRTLLARDGKAVDDAKPERRERRARQQRRSGLDDAVDVLRFWIDGRESVDGRNAVVVRFEPKPDARPSTREGRVARVMKGTIWVDEAAREVMRAEAVAIENLSFGLGMIARLNEGTHVSLTREPVENDIWMPTSIRFTGEGRALLFRKLTVNHVIEWFDYRLVGGEQALPESEP